MPMYDTNALLEAGLPQNKKMLKFIKFSFFEIL